MRFNLLPDKRSSTASVVAQGEESKEPRKADQPGVPQGAERSTPDLNNHSKGTNGTASGNQVHNGTSGPVPQPSVGEKDANQDTQSNPPQNEELQLVAPVLKIPRPTPESASELESIEAVVEKANKVVTHVTTTTTKVEERKDTDIQTSQQSVSASLQTSAGQQHDVQATVQHVAEGKVTSNHGAHPPPVTESASVAHAIASMFFGSGQHGTKTTSTHHALREKFLEMERLRRKDMDYIASLINIGDTECHDQRESIDVRLKACEAEKDRLLQENSTLTAYITFLKTQGDSLGDAYSEVTSQCSVTITTITTTITTVTARIEKWKHTIDNKKGLITITGKDVDQLLLELSTTSSQIKELHHKYAELLKNLTTVRLELQLVSSHQEEKDRTIVALTAQVDQWKRADSRKADQITIFRREIEEFRRDLSIASSRTTELQKRCDAQHAELSAARKELHAKILLVEGKERAVVSLTADVTRWKTLEEKKSEQISIIRRDYQKLQKDFSACSSKASELQTCHDKLYKELSFVRNELQVHKSSVEEKDRIINGLRVELENWKHADASKDKQIVAIRNDKEKLHKDLKIFTSQTAELKEHNDAQTKEIASLRAELRAKVSLLQEKEHTITTLTAEVKKAKHEASVEVEHTSTARRDADRLRGELSAASSRYAELQGRLDARSKELTAVRDELHRATLHPSGKDRQVAIDAALVLKNKEITELRGELLTYTNRHAELHKSYDSVTKDLHAVRDELKVKASHSETAITSLTTEVQKWKQAEATKAEQLAATVQEVEKYQQNLSTFTSRLTEVQSLYEAQTSELISLRTTVRSSTSSHEIKDRKITYLTAELEGWKRSDAAKVEQISNIEKRIEQLQVDLSSSSFKLKELQGTYEAQTNELTSVRQELHEKISLHESTTHTVHTLTEELKQWKRTDETKIGQIATITKEVESLQLQFSATTSKLGELKGVYEAQSRELESVSQELQVQRSSREEKEHRVVTLTAEVEEWKRTSVTLKEQHKTTIETLQHELAKSSSHFVELKHRYETQTKEFEELKNQTVTLTSQIETLKQTHITEEEELSTCRKDLTHLRGELSTLSTQLIDYQKHTSELTTQIEEWKRSDAAKQVELVDAKKRIEKVEAESAAGKQVFVGFKQEGGAKVAQAERFTVSAGGELEVHESKVFFDSKETKEIYQRITTEVKDYSSIISLTTSVDEWLRAEAKRTEELSQLALEFAKRTKENEELRKNLVTLKEIHVRAPILKEIFVSKTVETRKYTEGHLKELESTASERQSKQSGHRLITAPDTHTDAAIIEVLQKLNEEVHQSAKLLAHYVVDSKECTRNTRSAKKHVPVVQHLLHHISQPLLDHLGTDSVDETRLYLQIAMRAYLTNHLHWMISSWTAGKEHNDQIKQIYEHLQKSESQTVSGQWRSLTRTYVSPTSHGTPDALVSEAIHGLADIIIAARFVTSSTTVKSTIVEKFGDKISALISTAEQFKKAIGETVSADFEVFVAHSSETYAKATMEVETDIHGKNHGSHGTLDGQKVLCSTRLGMTKRVRLESGQDELSTVTKTKVVLESFSRK